MSDGIFTQPGPDGIFGRGGPPGDASSPSIDSDGTELRETLVVSYPSAGHMRVARATRNAKTGQIVEFQEQAREPTPEEVEILKRHGVVVGPGSMVRSSSGMPAIGEVPEAPVVPGWVKIAGAVAVGAAGLWAVNKWVLPKFASGGDEGDEGAADDAVDADETDDDDGDDT